MLAEFIRPLAFSSSTGVIHRVGMVIILLPIVGAVKVDIVNTPLSVMECKSLCPLLTQQFICCTILCDMLKNDCCSAANERAVLIYWLSILCFLDLFIGLDFWSSGFCVCHLLSVGPVLSASMHSRGGGLFFQCACRYLSY